MPATAAHLSSPVAPPRLLLSVIGTVFNVLTNVLDHGMNLFDAVAAPRVVARGGSTVLMEHQYVAGVR